MCDLHQLFDNWNANDSGVVVAIIASIIAWITYRSGARAAARSHMHSILREYLQIRITSKNEDIAHVVGYKMYMLEEVFLWLEREKSSILSIKHSDSEAWENTIKHHLTDKDQLDDTLKYLSPEKQNIFDHKFQKFIIKNLPDCQFKL